MTFQTFGDAFAPREKSSEAGFAMFLDKQAFPQPPGIQMTLLPVK
jgi:hypothetical protein